MPTVNLATTLVIFVIDAEQLGGVRSKLQPARHIDYYCTGDHQQPVAFVPAGEPAVLAERRYDVRASFVRSHDPPDLWRRDLVVKAGQVLQETIGFPQDATHHRRPQRLKW